MDDIMDLLGPDLSQVPSSKSPWDDLPPMQEPVVTDTTNQADLWLPTNVAMHYREYDRTGPAVDSLMEKIKRDGILTPIQISTNGSVAVVHEGNHRLQVADRLGIGRIPCKITYDLPIISNGGMVAPLESVLENWVSMNKDRMRSFRGSRVAGTEFAPGPVYRGINTDMLTHEKTASPQTLYRGIPLSPDKATSDRIQRSFEAGDFYTVGEEILRIVDRDTGAGTSWTTRDGVAVRFALSNDSWIPYGSFAVVLEGHWAGGNIDHSRDRDDDDPDRYEEFEDEVRLFAGDKVTVTKISVRAGTRAQDAESYMESLKWTTWDVHRTLTALNEKSVEKRKTTSQRYAESLARYRR